jgi:alpha-ribazole phosphatase
LTKLLLVRHGETQMNSSQRYWGKTDVALGALGLKAAESLRDRLAGQKIDFAYSSALRRALVTARIVASSHNLKVVSCPELNEIDFGKMEGLDFNEVNGKFPEVARLWMQRSPDLAYPEGESLYQLDKRVTEFKQRLARQAAGDVVLVVSHSGVLRTLICQLLGLESAARWKIRLDLGSLSIVDTYSDAAILSLLNDTSHLFLCHSRESGNLPPSSGGQGTG